MNAILMKINSLVYAEIRRYRKIVVSGLFIQNDPYQSQTASVFGDDHPLRYHLSSCLENRPISHLFRSRKWTLFKLGKG